MMFPIQNADVVRDPAIAGEPNRQRNLELIIRKVITK